MDPKLDITCAEVCDIMHGVIAGEERVGSKEFLQIY
jgi:hypothetical protein